MSAPLVDSHSHLDLEGLAEDLDGVLERARAASVARIATIGTGGGTDSAPRALAIAREHSGWIAATAGIHPHDARLVETDAPFLAPVPHRGRRNEPAFVAETARMFAALRGVEEDAIRRLTADNAVQIFHLDPLETN